MDKIKLLLKYSNPNTAQENAFKYYGNHAIIFISTRKSRKYMIMDIKNNKWVHFGKFGIKDFTVTKNEADRQHHLKLTINVKGDWHKNNYSANQLNRLILYSK
jgi:hypothetical protein